MSLRSRDGYRNKGNTMKTKSARCTTCGEEYAYDAKGSRDKDLLSGKYICACCADDQSQECAALHADYVRFEMPKPARPAPPSPMLFSTAHKALAHAARYRMDIAGVVLDPASRQWTLLCDALPLSDKPVVLCVDGSLWPLDGQPLRLKVGN